MKISTFAGVAASLVLATVTFVPPVAAQTIASKLELQGKPKHLEVTDLMARTRNGLMALNIEIRVPPSRTCRSRHLPPRPPISEFNSPPKKTANPFFKEPP